jgi:HlyD family secretion protein
MNQPRRTSIFYWLAGAVLVAGAVTCVVLYVTQMIPGPQRAQAREVRHQDTDQEEDVSQPTRSVVVVVVVRPQKGMDYEVEQPGSVHAYQTVQLHANVSGFLKTQSVDIGDRVKKGQVLAVIAVPELDKQLQRNGASLEQTRARVKQMEARVSSAQADHEAARAAIVQADATHKSASAWVRFRAKQHDRMKDLFKLGSVEERLVDESKERHEASLETERSTLAAIATSNANLVAMAAKIKQAEADVTGAESEVKVAQADLEKTQVMLDYAVITAPFDGEICHRKFFPGDFIRSGSDGAQPLLTIQRTDKLRVVVKVPDTAVPFVDKGDPAIVRIDSLPGKKFPGVVSRKSGTEDLDTRLMHVEVDVLNPTGEIGDGMYGKVKILLDRFPNLFSVPASSIVRTRQGHPAVWVVSDDRVHLSEVRVCKDNGNRVALYSGVAANDLIVLHPVAGLTDGAAVETQVIAEPPTRRDDEP